MWIKYPVILLSFLIFALIQVSFLPHFLIVGQFPGLVFALFFVVVFFEDQQEYVTGICSALAAGFLLDIIGPFSFGYHIIFLLLVFGILKTVTYFLKERTHSYLFFYFIPMFLASFALHYAFLRAMAQMPHLELQITRNFFIALLYNAPAASLLFYIYKKIYFLFNNKKQLRLF